MKKKLLRSFLAFAFLLSFAGFSQAQESFMGEIKLVGLNFTPRNWADCNGQLLPINKYQSLYALLGTTYGGDGSKTFALPDLRGRVPVGIGTGPGLKEVKMGQTNTPEKNAAAGKDIAIGTTPYLGMRYIICVTGSYPDRN